MHSERIQHVKGKENKHGISIVLKLVSIEYQRGAAFLAAVCGKTDSYLGTASQPINQGDQYGGLSFVYSMQQKILNCILINTLVFGA